MARDEINPEKGKQLPLFEFSQDNLNKLEQYPSKSNTDTSDFGRYIVYVDESGDHSLNSIDENYPVFVLAFCVFQKRHYSEAIVPALEKLKFNHFGHDQVILHEHEIRKRIGLFNFSGDRSHHEKFMQDLTDIVNFGNFILISAVIDKRRLTRQYADSNAYHIALTICMDALFEFLQEKNEQQKKTHVVFECRGKKEDKELELEFRRVCDGANQHSINMPFEIIFSDKKAMSTGLQLADLVARPIGLNTYRPNQENRAFYELKNKFYCDSGRDGAGEGYAGVGLNIFPTPKSEKPR